MLGLRTSGDAWREFLYKGEPLQTIRERLEELEAAGLDKVRVCARAPFRSCCCCTLISTLTVPSPSPRFSFANRPSSQDQGLLLRLRDNGNDGNNNYAGDGEWF